MLDDYLKAKAELRARQRSARRALTPAFRGTAARLAAWHALAHLTWRDRQVAVFWPLADEIDTRPLLHTLHWLGAQPLLPRMTGPRAPLTFHAWTPQSVLEEARFGVLEPLASAPAGRPDLVLAPLLAFDEEGGRLGYGAGFYDATLTALAREGPRPPCVGFCFAMQKVDKVPEATHDQRLDAVVTEDGLTRLGGAVQL